MAYWKNDTSKYSNQSRNVTEIMDDYFLERKASKIPAMATLSNYNSSISTLSSSNHSQWNTLCQSMNKPSSSISSSSVLSKIQDYTRDIKGKQKNERIEQLNKKLIDNVNVMNIRYIDTNSNNYFTCNLNKFKHVDKYNAKAQEIYSKDLHPNKGLWTINVTDKVFQYRKQFK